MSGFRKCCDCRKSHLLCDLPKVLIDKSQAGGVRHDPQRFMGKTVYVPHFNRDTVEFASRERDKSKPGIETLLPFLKNNTEESDLENSQNLIDYFRIPP